MASGVYVFEKHAMSLKNALHHVIRETPREWHKVIPYIVWAYREVPNSTTSVAPYTLLYGRLLKGSLAILKNSWAGELELPSNLGKSVAAYLQELKENLEIAANFAIKHAKAEQASYAEYYSRRTKDKHFHVGKKMLVLTLPSIRYILGGMALVQSRRCAHLTATSLTWEMVHGGTYTQIRFVSSLFAHISLVS